MPINDAALAFTEWTEAEATRRIATLRGCGWTANQLASMFGVSIEEIDRLAGESDQPASAAAREVPA